MDKKSTSDVVNMLGCHRSTVKNWARKNGVEAIYGAKGEILSYLWTDEDIARFQERPRPGRRWYKEEEEKR